jgi:hypothetical protein
MKGPLQGEPDLLEQQPLDVVRRNPLAADEAIVL